MFLLEVRYFYLYIYIWVIICLYFYMLYLTDTGNFFPNKLVFLINYLDYSPVLC